MPPSPPTPERRRVLLVEDHVIVREGIARIITASGEWTICGETSDGRAARDLAGRLRPNLVLLDFLLTGKDGFDLIRDLCGLPQPPRILVLSVVAESDLGERVIACGAHGYLNKRADSHTLLAAMAKVANGGVVASTELKLRLVAHRIGAQEIEPPETPLGRLSNREFEVLLLIGGDLSVSEISHRLGVSVRTVETHRDHIRNKLNLHTAGEVARWARAWYLQWEQANERGGSL